MTDTPPKAHINTKVLCSTILALVVATLISGVIHGRGARRWTDNPGGDALQAAVDRVTSIPKTIGDWETVEEADLPGPVQQILQTFGYVQRTYVNSIGQRVLVAVLVGPPGPMSVHKPEICYSSQNSRMTDTARATIGKAEDDNSLWRVDFKPLSLDATPFRVYYGYSEDGKDWTATENPRLVHGGADYLFKIQLAYYGVLSSDDEDPARSFLEALMALP